MHRHLQRLIFACFYPIMPLSPHFLIRWVFTACAPPPPCPLTLPLVKQHTIQCSTLCKLSSALYTHQRLLATINSEAKSSSS